MPAAASGGRRQHRQGHDEHLSQGRVHGHEDQHTTGHGESASGSRRSRHGRDAGLVGSQLLEDAARAREDEAVGGVAIHAWFSRKLGRPVGEFIDVDEFRGRWSSRTSPAIPSKLVVAGKEREQIAEGLREWWRTTSNGNLYVHGDTKEEATLADAPMKSQLAPDIATLLARTYGPDPGEPLVAAAAVHDDDRRRCTAESVAATSAKRTEDDLSREHLAVGERDSNVTCRRLRRHQEDASPRIARGIRASIRGDSADPTTSFWRTLGASRSRGTQKSITARSSRRPLRGRWGRIPHRSADPLRRPASPTCRAPPRR
jgi:hypothetical protein